MSRDGKNARLTAQPWALDTGHMQSCATAMCTTPVLLQPITLLKRKDPSESKYDVLGFITKTAFALNFSANIPRRAPGPRQSVGTPATCTFATRWRRKGVCTPSNILPPYTGPVLDIHNCERSSNDPIGTQACDRMRRCVRISIKRSQVSMCPSLAQWER